MVFPAATACRIDDLAAASRQSDSDDEEYDSMIFPMIKYATSSVFAPCQFGSPPTAFHRDITLELGHFLGRVGAFFTVLLVFLAMGTDRAGWQRSEATSAISGVS